MRRLLKTYVANSAVGFYKTQDDFYIITMNKYTSNYFEITVNKNKTFLESQSYNNEIEAIEAYHNIQFKYMGSVINSLHNWKNNGGWERDD